MASRTARRLDSLLAREAALVARLAALPAGGSEADMVKALTRKLFDVRVRRRNLGRNARRTGGLEEQVDLDKNSNVIKTTSDDVKEAEEEVAGEAGGDSELESGDGEAWPCTLPTCSSSNSPSRIHCRSCGSARLVREDAITMAQVMYKQRGDVEQILGIMHRQKGGVGEMQEEQEVPSEKIKEEETPNKGKVKEIVESIEKLEVADIKEIRKSERRIFPARRLAPCFPATCSTSVSSTPSASFTSIQPLVEVGAAAALLCPSTPSGGVTARRRGRRVDREIPHQEEVQRCSSPSYPGCTCPSPRSAPRASTPCPVHPNLHHLLGVAPAKAPRSLHRLAM